MAIVGGRSSSRPALNQGGAQSDGRQETSGAVREHLFSVAMCLADASVLPLAALHSLY